MIWKTSLSTINFPQIGDELDERGEAAVGALEGGKCFYDLIR
jgi:hypothetical protein